MLSLELLWTTALISAILLAISVTTVLGITCAENGDLWSFGEPQGGPQSSCFHSNSDLLIVSDCVGLVLHVDTTSLVSIANASASILSDCRISFLTRHSSFFPEGSPVLDLAALGLVNVSISVEGFAHVAFRNMSINASTSIQLNASQVELEGTVVTSSSITLKNGWQQVLVPMAAFSLHGSELADCSVTLLPGYHNLILVSEGSRIVRGSFAVAHMGDSTMLQEPHRLLNLRWSLDQFSQIQNYSINAISSMLGDLSVHVGESAAMESTSLNFHYLYGDSSRVELTLGSSASLSDSRISVKGVAHARFLAEGASSALPAMMNHCSVTIDVSTLSVRFVGAAAHDTTFLFSGTRMQENAIEPEQATSVFLASSAFVRSAVTVTGADFHHGSPIVISAVHFVESLFSIRNVTAIGFAHASMVEDFRFHLVMPPLVAAIEISNHSTFFHSHVLAESSNLTAYHPHDGVSVPLFFGDGAVLGQNSTLTARNCGFYAVVGAVPASAVAPTVASGRRCTSVQSLLSDRSYVVRVNSDPLFEMSMLRLSIMEVSNADGRPHLDIRAGLAKSLGCYYRDDLSPSHPTFHCQADLERPGDYGVLGVVSLRFESEATGTDTNVTRLMLEPSTTVVVDVNITETENMETFWIADWIRTDSPLTLQGCFGIDSATYSGFQRRLARIRSAHVMPAQGVMFADKSTIGAGATVRVEGCSVSAAFKGEGTMDVGLPSGLQRLFVHDTAQQLDGWVSPDNELWVSWNVVSPLSQGNWSVADDDDDDQVAHAAPAAIALLSSVVDPTAKLQLQSNYFAVVAGRLPLPHEAGEDETRVLIAAVVSIGRALMICAADTSPLTFAASNILAPFAHYDPHSRLSEDEEVDFALLHIAQSPWHISPRGVVTVGEEMTAVPGDAAGENDDNHRCAIRLESRPLVRSDAGHHDLDPQEGSGGGVPSFAPPTSLINLTGVFSTFDFNVSSQDQDTLASIFVTALMCESPYGAKTVSLSQLRRRGVEMPSFAALISLVGDGREEWDAVCVRLLSVGPAPLPNPVVVRVPEAPAPTTAVSPSASVFQSSTLSRDADTSEADDSSLRVSTVRMTFRHEVQRVVQDFLDIRSAVAEVLQVEQRNITLEDVVPGSAVAMMSVRSVLRSSVVQEKLQRATGGEAGSSTLPALLAVQAVNVTPSAAGDCTTVCDSRGTLAAFTRFPGGPTAEGECVCECRNQFSGTRCGDCRSPYDGVDCDRCAPGLSGYPACGGCAQPESPKPQMPMMIDSACGAVSDVADRIDAAAEVCGAAYCACLGGLAKNRQGADDGATARGGCHYLFHPSACAVRLCSGIKRECLRAGQAAAMSGGALADELCWRERAVLEAQVSHARHWCTYEVCAVAVKEERGCSRELLEASCSFTGGSEFSGAAPVARRALTIVLLVFALSVLLIA